jgi:hypothetical protein
LLRLTGDDILVQRGAARARDERAAKFGRRAMMRRDAMFAQEQLPESMWGGSFNNVLHRGERGLAGRIGNGEEE